MITAVEESIYEKNIMDCKGYEEMGGSNSKCQRCGCEISVEERYVINGVTVCDDCYLEESGPVKACNPLAVSSAKRFMESGGPETVARLNEQQRAIYELIKSRGKATSQEIIDKFSISQIEATNQFAVLWHLELTKGKKEGNITYIIPFEFILEF